MNMKIFCRSDVMKVYIYYDCSWEDIRKIEDRFGFPHCVTVNGETCRPVDVRDEDWELLRETERRGYIQIRNKKDDTDTDKTLD